MPSGISIIIPVYNAEKYLRRCLDSVVGQTLQDIQVICVNDGSKDNSLPILREYAQKDSRFQVIDRLNTGNPGAPRNAGLSHVRGKYLYFIDADDWIDPTLCEKAYYRLESTEADVVFFFCHYVDEAGHEKRMPDPFGYCQWSTVSLQSKHSFRAAPWNRVIRTTFFQGLGTQFPELLCGEDRFMHWALLANEPRIEVIPEKLYYHRLHGASIMGQRGEGSIKANQAYSFIEDYLISIGKYEQYRSWLLIQKFNGFHFHVHHLRKSHQSEALHLFRESLNEESMNFLRNDERLDSKVRDSILHLLGETSAFSLKSIWYSVNRHFLKKMLKPIEVLVRILRGKLQLSKTIRKSDVSLLELRIRELSEQIFQRDRDIVHLKRQLKQESTNRHAT